MKQSLWGRVMFGLGLPEIIILCILLAVPLAVIAIVVRLITRGRVNADKAGDSKDINRAAEDISDVPGEVVGWNWGAFFLTWIWGIGNNVSVALLALIPPVWPIMAFILGVKGNEWAWRQSEWESVRQFKRVQSIWARFGIGVATIVVVLAVLLK
jgi:hypothetical protein